MRTRCAARLTRCISTRDSRRIPDGAVGERVEVEVAAELAVDPDQQVAVERGGHAERIVVGEQQVALRLHEIGAEQQRVARRERRADARAGTRRRRADRSCRCSIRGTASAASRPSTRVRASPRRARPRRSPGGSIDARPRRARRASGRRARARPPRRRPGARQRRRRRPARRRAASRASRRCRVRARRASTAAPGARQISPAVRARAARVSARVMRYHGSPQIASNSAEPSAS